MRDQRASTAVVTRLKELGVNRRVSLDDMEGIVAAALVEPRAENEQLRNALVDARAALHRACLVIGSTEGFRADFDAIHSALETTQQDPSGGA